MKKIILLLGVVLLVFTGWKLYRKIEEPTGEYSRRRGARQVPVEIMAVRRGTIREVGVFTGSLKPRSRFVVAPKVSGRLEKLLVNIGDRLKPGQLMAMLDDDEYEQQLLQAEAYLEVARANLEAGRNATVLAKREFERIRSLKSRKLVSASELDAAKAKYTDQQAKYRTAKAQLSEKQAAVEVVRIRLSYTRIKALWNEPTAELVVAERFVDEGALLSPNSAIVSVIDISSVTAVIHVTERDYFKLKTGQPTTVTADAIPGERFEGRITRIAPLIKETSREALVEIEIPNTRGRLRPGLFIRASIHFDTHRNSIIVPLRALVKRGNTTGVFVVELENKRARYVPIEVGIVDKEQAEVVSPSLSGQVVTLGHHLLEDGTAIVLPRPKEPSDSSPTKKGGQPKSTSKRKKHP
ncbi:MAG: efflux RND transporter periplasmic adaptor subunit [Proteobacteria bacterium]|nr:efflux RND transporter periplasmic adaptor subunit [Pseudomonadota bacterium]